MITKPVNKAMLMENSEPSMTYPVKSEAERLVVVVAQLLFT